MRNKPYSLLFSSINFAALIERKDNIILLHSHSSYYYLHDIIYDKQTHRDVIIGHNINYYYTSY